MFFADPDAHLPYTDSVVVFWNATEPVFALEPPYRSLRTVKSSPLPLGTIIAFDYEGGIVALASALRSHYGAPWCPVCVIVKGKRLDQTLFDTLQPFPSSFAVASIEDADSLYKTDSLSKVVVRAVRLRPSPGPRLVAEFVAKRVRVHGLIDVLKTCLEAATFEGCSSTPPRGRNALAPTATLGPVVTPSATTFSRHLRRYGPLTRRDWRTVWRLVDILTGMHDRSSARGETLAREHGLDPRTLRRWVRHYVGTSLTQAVARPGWEWILESVLRRWGYQDALGGRVAGATIGPSTAPLMHLRGLA
jgi:hypothetical protein